MITPEEIQTLKQKYGAGASRICRICRGRMDMAANGELYCFEQGGAQRYTTEWWTHYTQSNALNGAGGDPLVLKLIETFENANAYEELKKRKPK